MVKSIPMCECSYSTCREEKKKKRNAENRRGRSKKETEEKKPKERNQSKESYSRIRFLDPTKEIGIINLE